MKAVKLRHKLVSDPVFRSQVFFYVCENGNDAIKHLKKKYDIVIGNPGFDEFTGICVEARNSKMQITFWLVWIKHNKDWKAMVHESAHLVFRILNNRLVKYSSNNDETWCYLQEFFVSEFWHEMVS